MDFAERKAERVQRFFEYVFGWTLSECVACAGSGRYDHNGSPPCSGCDGTGKESYRPPLTKLYDALRRSLAAGRLKEAKHLAEHLERRLEGSGVTYGWNRLPLTGEAVVDGAIQALDRYFTGPRKSP